MAAIAINKWTCAQEIEPEKYFGFVYLIEDITLGLKYIGKKQFWSSKSGIYGCKSKVMDKGSPKWKCKCWRESDWRKYKGSSKDLKAHMKQYPKNDYRYTILHQCRTKAQLTYMELQEQIDRRVLTEITTDGSGMYFNRQVAAVKYRPAATIEEKIRLKMTHGGQV